ncbi:hypothetical protein FRC20_006120 [Serendipita sp. 405]|nr:hypothetical protein FRC20_006120 [Serendipita sp. 405]
MGNDWHLYRWWRRPSLSSPSPFFAYSLGTLWTLSLVAYNTDTYYHTYARMDGTGLHSQILFLLPSFPIWLSSPPVHFRPVHCSLLAGGHECVCRFDTSDGTDSGAGENDTMAQCHDSDAYVPFYHN